MLEKIKKNCLYCDKEFCVYPCLKRLKYCSKKCYHNHGHIEASKSLSKAMKKYFKTRDAWNKNRPWTKEEKQTISEGTKKGMTITVKNKIRKVKLLLFKDPRNHPSYIPDLDRTYPINFDESLKRKIRLRDNYTCQLCGIYQRDYLKLHLGQLGIHHIDYNKQNCDEDNLITLCHKCNSKVNFNRDYWFAYFSYIFDTEITKDKIFYNFAYA